MTQLDDLRALVETPSLRPWIPPPPPLDLTVPIILADLETLARTVDGLKKVNRGP